MNRSIVAFIIFVLLIPSFTNANTSDGDFRIKTDNTPPIFVNVFNSTSVVQQDLDVEFFADVGDVDNSSAQITVILYYSNDSFVVQNDSQVMSFDHQVQTDVYQYSYLFGGEPVGTYYEYYYTAHDGNTTIREPSTDLTFLDIQWGIVVGDDGGSSSGGGSGTGITAGGNLQVIISVFYKYSAQVSARVEIEVYSDFLKQIKISSFTTYTDSGGTAIVKIEVSAGQWVVVHVYKHVDGKDREAEEQNSMRTGQTKMSFSINLFFGFLPFKNSITKEFMNGILLMISLLVIVLGVSYISKRAYKRGGLYQEMIVEGRLGERKTKQYIYGKTKKKKRQFGGSSSKKSRRSVHKALR